MDDDDDRPRCTFIEGADSGCYCTDRPGCARPPIDDEDAYPDDDSCCARGEDDHDGPCEWQCNDCGGTGRCPACNGDAAFDDCTPCELCDGNGSCPGGCFEGRQIDDSYWTPPARIQTVQLVGGVL